MKQIKLKNMRIQNFKGCKGRYIDFTDQTQIFGANATGKTTIFDAFTWLLFNHDSSGSTKFDIRPLDAGGKIIDNVEISVEAVISVNEEEYVLKKVQKQKWVKKRGTDTTAFQGNVNEFEINGYPKSEKDFKEFIAGIIDEKVFNLITNPTAFNALPWKEQREMLMKFVGESSDVQIAEQFGEQFAKLIPELKIASTDDILKKYTKGKNTLNKDMVEIPARIDELSKQIVTVDVEALKVEKAAKQVALQKIDNELNGGNGKLEEVNQKRQQIMDLKLKLSSIQNDANEKLTTERSVARQAADNCEQKAREVRKQYDDAVYARDEFIRKRDQAESDKVRFAKEWTTEKSKVFPKFVPLEAFVEPKVLTTEDLKCPTCGQELPVEVKNRRIKDHEERCAKAKADYEARCEAHESKYKKDKEDFDASRKKNFKDITDRGQAAADSVREYQKLADEKQKEIDVLTNSLEKSKKAFSDSMANLNKIPREADVSGNEEYKKIQHDIENIESEIEELSNDSAGNTELETRKAVLQDEISEIDRKILAADNTKVQARIDELEAEKKSVGQKIAEQEQMIDLTEDFIRTKMNRISEIVNEKFKVVSFRLFTNQINGGLQETCECTVNGVPYSTLNNGHRIIAGLDIICSLSELYDVTAPIFCDNAESVNEFNLPEMDAQMILLTVTEDKELKVEGV